MKSRKVVTRSSRKFCGYFPSKKLGRMVQWESLLERDAILLFEFSGGIKNYQEQPDLVMYEQDGEMRRYYPDFSITLTNEKVIHVEVKPISKFTSLETVKKFNAVIKHYDSSGRNFSILVDESIRQEPRLSNLKRFASVQHDAEDLTEIKLHVIKLYENSEEFTVQTLGQIIGRRKVLQLLADGFLCCNLNVDLYSTNNFLRIAEEADHASILV